MHTIAIATAGHLLHFELAVAYEIFRTPPEELPREDWYDVQLCGPGPVDIGPFTLAPEYGLERLATADTVLVPACADVDVPPPAELVDAIRAAHDAAPASRPSAPGPSHSALPAYWTAAAPLPTGRTQQSSPPATPRPLSTQTSSTPTTAASSPLQAKRPRSTSAST